MVRVFAGFFLDAPQSGVYRWDQGGPQAQKHLIVRGFSSATGPPIFEVYSVCGPGGSGRKFF